MSEEDSAPDCPESDQSEISDDISCMYELHEPSFDVNSCLPLSLQQFCLITIINELDSYPIESLAKLPLHCRRLLLSNIPNVDLCKLDETPVAEGIDVGKIWRAVKTYKPDVQAAQPDKTFARLSLFMFRQEAQSGIEYLRNIHDDFDLEPALAVALKKRSQKELILVHLLLDLLWFLSLEPVDKIKEYGFNFDHEVDDALTSILGHEFLVELPGAKTWKDLPDFQHCEGSEYEEYETETLMNFYQLWKIQATPLSRFSRHTEGITYDFDKIVHLVPKRLVSIRESTSPLDFLNCICIRCGLQPLNLRVASNELHQAMCNLEAYYTAGEDCHLFLKALLKRIVVLDLHGISSEHCNTLRRIFELLTIDRNATTLKSLTLGTHSSLLDLGFLNPYLFAIPTSSLVPCYQGLNVLEIDYPIEPSCLPQLTALIEQQQSLGYLYVSLADSFHTLMPVHVEPLHATREEDELSDKLSLLFDRENFRCLRIKFVCKHGVNQILSEMFPIAKILHGFMCSPCAHNQTLRFEPIYSSPKQQLQPVALSRSTNMTPECATQHKVFIYDFVDHDLIIRHLLQLPVICLRDIAFNFDEESKSLFSQLCLHPSLKVTHFLVKFAIKPVFYPENVEGPLSSICQDFEKLFQMPTLKEFSLIGEWLCSSEIKKAVVIGLQQQSRVCSLRKICFRHDLISGWKNRSYMEYRYKEFELRELWHAIFSLPHVEQLELDLWTEGRITEHFIDSVHIIYDCWTEFADEKKKLKTLTLSLDEWVLSRICMEEQLEPFTKVACKLKNRISKSGKEDEIKDYN